MPCKICRKNFPESELSEEHIFPAAIGGNLILKDVCKNACNNFLGTRVDSTLTDHIYCKLARDSFPPESAVCPPPKLFDQKFTADDGAGVNVLGRGGNFTFKRQPIIECTEDGNCIQVVAATIEEGRQILEKLTKRRNLPAPTDENIVIEEIRRKSLIDAHIPVDLIQYKKALVKICFELGLLFLGDQYGASDYAQNIRRFLFDETQDWCSPHGLDGYFEINKGQHHSACACHLAGGEHSAVLMHSLGAISCTVCVFGIFCGGMAITSAVDDYPHFKPKLVSVDVMSKATAIIDVPVFV